MTEEQTPEWHANTIADAVLTKGYCIFWSELFQEKIAFIRDLRTRRYVPGGIPVYSSTELKELFVDGKPSLSSKDLKLLHEAKKAGGVIESYIKNEQSDRD